MGKRAASEVGLVGKKVLGGLKKTVVAGKDITKDTVRRGKDAIVGDDFDQDTTLLPDDFDARGTRDQRKEEQDSCELCGAGFTKRVAALNLLKKTNPSRHCKRCSRAVCEVCSEQRRQLSKNDAARYRVCDLCDFELENAQILINLNQVSTQTQRKIEVLNSHVEQFEENKEALTKIKTGEQKTLIDELEHVQKQRDAIRRKQSQAEDKSIAQRKSYSYLH